MKTSKRILSMLLALAMILSIMSLGVFAEEPAANIATKATASSGTCASWNKVAGVNDGVVPAQSQGDQAGSYGSWGQNNACDPEMITLTWNTEVQLSGAGMFFCHDNGKDNRTGIDFPVSYSFEYLDGEEWKAVSNADGMLVDEDTVNRTSFDQITTTALRVVMTKESASDNSYGIGVAEFEAYGALLSLDTDRHCPGRGDHQSRQLHRRIRRRAGRCTGGGEGNSCQGRQDTGRGRCSCRCFGGSLCRPDHPARGEAR